MGNINGSGSDTYRLNLEEPDSLILDVLVDKMREPVPL